MSNAMDFSGGKELEDLESSPEATAAATFGIDVRNMIIDRKLDIPQATAGLVGNLIGAVAFLRKIDEDMANGYVDRLGLVLRAAAQGADVNKVMMEAIGGMN